MAVTQIKDGYNGGSDNQAFVDSTGALKVTGGGGGGAIAANITEIGGAPISEGQKTMANSFPVVIASDQSAIPITGTVTAVNASVGLTGTIAPTSATEIGAVDSGGNLQHLTVDPSGKLLVDISGTSTVTGTVNADIVGLTAFLTSQYSIGTSAVQITPTPLTNRSSVCMRATTISGNIVYVGPTSAVTTTTGYPMYNGDTIQMDLTAANSIWAISGAAGQTLFALEIA